MSVELIRIAGDDLDIVNGFRKSLNRSHQEFNEADRRLISRGMNDGHTEPFRHCWAKFHIECSIGCARQVMTHKRYMAISEHSTRYSKMPDDFIMPALKIQVGKPMEYRYIEADPEKLARGRAIVERSRRQAYADYQELLAEGFCREDARSVLQLCQQTALIVSGDMAAWLRFLNRRTSAHAQDEIRGVAHEIEAHLRAAMPVTFEAWDAAERPAL